MENENKSVLGNAQCIAILVGGMIGAAIFSLSGLTILNAGPASILSWIIAAVIFLFYGLMTAELSTIYPRSGGIFVFSYEALGKTKNTKSIWGWITAWSWLNVALFGSAFCAIYVAQYLSIAFPFFSNIVLWAVIWIIGCGVLCLFNIQLAGTVNLILTAVLVVLMLVYSIAGVGAYNPANFVPFFTQGVGGSTGFISSIPIAMMAFNAISAVAFMVSLIRKPKKTIPKSMIISMIITIVLYVFILVSTIGMVGAKYFIENPGTQYVPLYSAAWTVLYSLPWLPAAISIAATLALTTTLLVLLMTAGWTVQSAAEYGLLPKFLGKVNAKTKVPTSALILCIVVVLIFAVIPKFTDYLINTGGISNAICVIMVAVTLIAARRNHRFEEGDFRLGGKSVIPVIVALLVAAFILPVVFQALTYWYLYLAWMAVGAVIFLIFKFAQPKVKA
jgi:basic amino acid/polyamine antiporter, APA family